MRRLPVLSSCLASLLAGCVADNALPLPDGTLDITEDGGRDAEFEPGLDADLDAHLDADLDASPDAGPDELVDGAYRSCRTHADCPQPLACEYWYPGCERLGECRRMLVGLDAFTSCHGICDCEGYWRGNAYTDFPFQRRDFRNENGPCLPTDGGVPDGWTGFGEAGPPPFCPGDD